MQTLEYRTIDKSTWGAGPWQDEPDKMQYPDPVTGLPCLIVRARQGHLCGYVGVAADHPYYKQYPHDLEVRVHGGLNFGEPCSPHATEDQGICHLPDQGETDAVWWLGFDCGHHEDVSPGANAQIRELIPAHDLSWMSDGIYRTVDYVKAQIASLALQLSKV